jgi:NADPH2:quinone reductase
VTLPTIMQHIAVTGPGGPEVMHLAGAPVPHPAAGEILVQVQAAGVNRPDVLQRQGRYPMPPGVNPTMGLEIAGTVSAVGDGVTGFTVGEKVCALANGGGYAEYCVVPAGQALPWPRGYDAVRAAALPETFFTVWVNLFGHGHLKAGETVLIHGGSSGIGTTAIMLARAFGARVITTVGGDDKAAACQALGAETINYRTQDFVEVCHSLTDNRGVDVILDMVAGSYLSRNVFTLAKDGRLVVIATQGGVQDPDFSIAPVMMKRLTITGSTMRPRTLAEKAAIADGLREKVWPLLDAGTVAPIINATFPLAQAAEAHRLMESGAHIGKIVLTVG